MRQLLPLPTSHTQDTRNHSTERLIAMPCGTCHRLPAPPPPSVLFQIDRGYTAPWAGLELSVRLEMNQWTVRVCDAESQSTLYTAYRCSLNAARQSAADFAIFHIWGFDSRLTAGQLCGQLDWRRSN